MRQNLTFIIMSLLLYSFIGCTSQKEKKLIEENKQLIKEYKRLGSELECLEERLDVINKTDSIIMQKVISDSIVNSSVRSVNH